MTDNEGVPLVLVDWIATMSRGHALQVWEWLDKRPDSGPQAILRGLERRFQR